ADQGLEEIGQRVGGGRVLGRIEGDRIAADLDAHLDAFDGLFDVPGLVLLAFGRPAEVEGLFLGLAYVHAHDRHFLLGLGAQLLIESFALVELPLEIDGILADGGNGGSSQGEQANEKSASKHVSYLPGRSKNSWKRPLFFTGPATRSKAYLAVVSCQ